MGSWTIWRGRLQARLTCLWICWELLQAPAAVRATGAQERRRQRGGDLDPGADQEGGWSRAVLSRYMRTRCEPALHWRGPGAEHTCPFTAAALQGWDGARAKCARLATRLRLAFGAVASRSRHRYLFQRPGSTTQASAAGSVGPGYSQLGSGGSHQEEEEDLEEEEELVLSEGQGESVVGGLREVLVGVGEGANAGASPNVDQPSPRQPLIGGRRDSIE